MVTHAHSCWRACAHAWHDGAYMFLRVYKAKNRKQVIVIIFFLCVVVAGLVRWADGLGVPGISLHSNHDMQHLCFWS